MLLIKDFLIKVVYETPRRPLTHERPVAQRLRMLAVFSLPVDASALYLRRERFQLALTIQQIAASQGKAVELRVLQYGATRLATRQRLEDALLEVDVDWSRSWATASDATPVALGASWGYRE